ncbi:hypothetical protein EK21DRAFT_95184 [Setomelanomma holmii]|uniref:Uncharacterized protein n=1 Tax=Setomelanomma holmii TaxID=210430 RepID=A0A9P4GX34_9PLEO|nr:hypothetical protein EK21DRAFT_95184 [Setomelanomma holmii]
MLLHPLSASTQNLKSRDATTRIREAPASPRATRIYPFVVRVLNLMAFDLDNVKPLDPNTDFSNIKVNDVSWVEGSGKEVQWKNSDVTVIEKDSDGKEHFKPLSSGRDGSLMLNSGMSLYIAGRNRAIGVLSSFYRGGVSTICSVCIIGVSYVSSKETYKNTNVHRLLHLSFREFLVDPQKQEKSPFWVDELSTHKKLASCCLELMSGPSGLRQDMCGLLGPGVLRSEIHYGTFASTLPPEL